MRSSIFILVSHYRTHTNRKQTNLFAFWPSKYLENDKTPVDAHTEYSQEALYTDAALVNIVDHLLETMDKNKDGYVDYTEYRVTDANHIRSG